MKPRTGDFAIAAIVLIVAVAIWVHPLLGNEREAQRVQIEHDGGIVRNILLGGETVLEVGGCEVRVENGEVFVAKSDCPDRVCVNTGRISRAGEAIICVPNRVSIKIIGEGKVDAIAG